MNHPVNGSIPRGFVGLSPEDNAKMMLMTGQTTNSAIRTTMNGSVPFYYKNNEDERLRATKDMVSNPYPITKLGLEKGKELYGIYCASCHGDKGDGQGYLVSESNPNAKYPAQPANFMQDQFYTSNNGRYYFAIMYGKNVMQSHADKLSYEERWQVIHYIRNMQAKAKTLAYDEKVNTFLPAAGTPYAVIAARTPVPAVSEVKADEHKATDHGAAAHPAAEHH
jgi:mono/diheme cytochrome c family protein